MSTRAYSSILALVLAPLSVFGCAEGTQSDEEIAEIQSALELDNGGMTTSTEQPSFADPAVAATPEMDDTFADAQPLTATIEAQPGAALYHLMVLWGHLPRANDAEPTQ